VSLCVEVAAQANARLTFDIASVKQNRTGNGPMGLRPTPSGLTATNLTLKMLIRQAYDIQDYEIIGGPAWINEDRWDVLAKAEGVGDVESTLLKFRSLLVDRFKLVTHNEQREMQAYALSLARSDGELGDKLRRSDVDCAALAKARGADAPPVLPKPGGIPECGMYMMMAPTTAALRGGGQPFASLVRGLGQFMARPIVDRTGLTGTYSIDLTFAADRSLVPGFAPPGGLPPGLGVNDQPVTDVPSLFTAVQEQLGLKLDSMRMPVDVLVIDSVERPTED
jgi:uncharacterized protein (TIGR03435 family)